MAHFLRKVAIIGFIAVNSPVHSGKPADTTLPQAEILAGLDPVMRERILNTAMTTATAKPSSR